jgi:hypothetical protein
LPLEYSTDLRWWLTFCDMLELWLMSYLLQDKPNVVFHHDGALPHIYNEVTAFLNRQLSEPWLSQEGFTFWLPISRSNPPQPFPVGVLWKMRLHSASACNPEQLEGLNTNSNRKTLSAFIAECLTLSWILSWCVQGNKWSIYWICIGYEKTLWVILYNGVC